MEILLETSTLVGKTTSTLNKESSTAKRATLAASPLAVVVCPWSSAARYQLRSIRVRHRQKLSKPVVWILQAQIAEYRKTTIYNRMIWPPETFLQHSRHK